MAYENFTNQTEKRGGVGEVVGNLFLTVHAIKDFMLGCERANDKGETKDVFFYILYFIFFSFYWGSY